ncbi:MAG: LacI family transcriptional regulator [Anaerolineae bacterium]|nr:LacI family transcriptional regulator [Anaerolineae bacterium]
MVRIKDVANEAGVSTATVSRVLSNKPYVTAEARERVMAAIKKLGYRPNQIARSLRSQQTTALGLIVSDVCNPFFTDVSRLVEDCAYKEGYSVFLCNSDEDDKKELFYLQQMLDKNVAGIIISPTQKTPENFALLGIDLPVVLYDRSVKGLDVDTIIIDNEDSAYQLAKHLIDNGYKRIAGIFCDVSTGYERQVGFEKAIKDAGYDAPQLIVTQPRIEKGYIAAKKLLNTSPRPDAVFTSDSLVLSGVMQAINESGLKVPDEIGLACFDDVAWMSLVTPPITVIRQPTDQIARMAVDLIMQRIENPSQASLHVVLKGQLIVRGSTQTRPA